jgi:acetyl-CoA acetyltransferase
LTREEQDEYAISSYRKAQAALENGTFNEGNKETGREIDFVKLRQGLAKGVPWTEELIESLMPGAEN